MADQDIHRTYSAIIAKTRNQEYRVGSGNKCSNA